MLILESGGMYPNFVIGYWIQLHRFNVKRFNFLYGVI